VPFGLGRSRRTERSPNGDSLSSLPPSSLSTRSLLMIHQLPAEVLLHIFGFLPLRALAACQGVYSAWLALVAAHSGCLYRSVMALEGLTAACRPASSIAHAVEDWRETCERLAPAFLLVWPTAG
jgi:hypothetical protein